MRVRSAWGVVKDQLPGQGGRPLQEVPERAAAGRFRGPKPSAQNQSSTTSFPRRGTAGLSCAPVRAWMRAFMRVLMRAQYACLAGTAKARACVNTYFPARSVQNGYIDTMPFTRKCGCGILSLIFASTMEVHNDVLQRSHQCPDPRRRHGVAKRTSLKRARSSSRSMADVVYIPSRNEHVLFKCGRHTAAGITQ